ncbi:iron permease FTR1 [Dacryopinax primogenitus]|uniref:Iron permease FTR1 n=1 Tax=Dacryopinax primogenitus (strain DJM 731) TaxID=1858805 RepID=M5GBD3_DACPD|nr:iron permease FTR1 [Dacryopinax primogenitus]EJU01308.1 iron permease FTR1 [Dacryopinax primogenitus]
MALTDKQLYRKLIWQIWFGTILGFVIALCIGAAFIAVFYTKLQDLWAQTEDLWEGIFALIASGLILAMGIAFLKLEGSSAKWRVHLSHAFSKKDSDREGRSGKYALMILPLITVLREGIEAIVFVGGVSMSDSAKSIPLAVVVGLVCGALVSYGIYRGAAAIAIRYFLVISTCILFLVGAGLASRALGFFQAYVFNQGVWKDVEELGDGPGSYPPDSVWHLTYGNPFNTQTGGGWSIFNAILGWNNTATLGAVLAYVFFWVFVICTLTFLKWKEGRTHLFGWKSKAYVVRQQRFKERAAAAAAAESASIGSDEKASLESPIQA